MNIASVFLRMAITLAFIGLVEFYAWQIVRTLIATQSENTRRIITYIWWAIPVFFLLTFIAGFIIPYPSWNPKFRVYLQSFFMIIFFTKMIGGFWMFIDDIRRLLTVIWTWFSTREVSEVSRSRFLAQTGLILGGAPFITLSYGILRNQYRFQVLRTDVPIKGLPSALSGLRIVQISDIHSGTFTRSEPLVQAVKMINDLKADIIFFTGDLVNNTADEITPYIPIFKELTAKYGVFSILGNHDYGDYYQWDSEADKIANLAKLKQAHTAMGWQVLCDENRILTHNETPFALIGVNNISAKRGFHTYGDLPKAYSGTESVATKILLSHDPSHWNNEVTANFKDIQLTLAGHTHGFQFGIEIPGWIKWSPAKFMYKQWAGLYEEAAQSLYVNRGFGCLGYPGRVGILPEISLLTLKTV